MRVWVVLCGLAVLVAGCGGGVRPPPAQPAPAPAPVKVYREPGPLTVAIGRAMREKDYATIRLPVANGRSATALYDHPNGLAVTFLLLDKEYEVVKKDGELYIELANAPGEPPTHRWVRFIGWPDEVVPVLPQAVVERIAAGIWDLDVDDRLATFDNLGALTLDSATPESLDGESTVRYELTVDVVKAAKLIVVPVQRAMLERSVQAGVKTTHITLWLNQQDLPVRTKQGEDVTSYTDWGKRVTIQRPPENEVITW